MWKPFPPDAVEQYKQRYPLSLFLELRVVQRRVCAALCKELRVRALLYDVAVVEDEDEVGVLDGGQAVRYHEGGAPFGQIVHRLLDQHFGAGVHAARSLVEDQERRVLRNGTGNGQQLLLPHREVDLVV